MTYCKNVFYLLLDWRSVRGEQASEAFSLAALREMKSTSLLERTSYTGGARIPEQYLQTELVLYVWKCRLWIKSETFSFRGIHTYDNCPNCEEHKGILLEESLDVLFGDLFHFPLCLHGAYVNSFPETLHPAVVNPYMCISANRLCVDLPTGLIDSFLDSKRAI